MKKTPPTHTCTASTKTNTGHTLPRLFLRARFHPGNSQRSIESSCVCCETRKKYLLPVLALQQPSKKYAMDQLAPTTSAAFLAYESVTACHTNHKHSHRNGAAQQLQFLLCSPPLDVLTCAGKLRRLWCVSPVTLRCADRTMSSRFHRQ